MTKQNELQQLNLPAETPEKPLAVGTKCIWAGEETYLMQGATQVPVVHSVSFGYHTWKSGFK